MIRKRSNHAAASPGAGSPAWPLGGSNASGSSRNKRRKITQPGVTGAPPHFPHTRNGPQEPRTCPLSGVRAAPRLLGCPDPSGRPLRASWWLGALRPAAVTAAVSAGKQFFNRHGFLFGQIRVLTGVSTRRVERTASREALRPERPADPGEAGTKAGGAERALLGPLPAPVSPAAAQKTKKGRRDDPGNGGSACRPDAGRRTSSPQHGGVTDAERFHDEGEREKMAAGGREDPPAGERKGKRSVTGFRAPTGRRIPRQ
jgi:hypothetical protein